ncbi:MAG: response regulator transcription factor [Steroidobacteraceae bacterium]|nr:response regulator transcription factor [Steroidobacteraceae bacterium]
MTRILLVDDEELMRQGLRKLLELSPDFEVVAEASDGLSALETLGRIKIEVMLLDVRMPRMGGLEVLDALRTNPDRPATIVLTTFDDPELLLEAARREARGFISKAVTLEELVLAIRAVADGATWFQPTVTSNLRKALVSRSSGREAAQFDSLTEREVEVLKLVAGGLTNREIAQTFSVADGTVKNQVSSILSKLAVHDRTLAVLKAIEAGII